METWDAIRSRRNVRQYEGRPIPRADLDRILEAGRRSPSSQNWQPWDFVVVTERGRLSDLAKVWQGAGHVARSAATVALVAPSQQEPRQREILEAAADRATHQAALR
jgi:nitroreductase